MQQVLGSWSATKSYRYAGLPNISSPRDCNMAEMVLSHRDFHVSDQIDQMLTQCYFYISNSNIDKINNIGLWVTTLLNLMFFIS